MTALEKGQRKQKGSSTKSFGASPTLGNLIPEDRFGKIREGANPVLQSKSGEEADLNEQGSSESGFSYWLKIVAAIGIPLALLYLAVAGLVNPQFAELRELVSDNRDAIAANSASIESLDAKIDSSVASLDAKIDSSVASLDAKIDSSVASLDAKIDSSVASLDAKIDSSVASLDAKIDSSVARLEALIDLVAEVLILAFTNDNITEGELRNLLDAGER